MSHLKVQPLVSHDGIGCTHIQTTERVIIKNTIDYSSAKFSLNIKLLHKFKFAECCSYCCMHQLYHAYCLPWTISPKRSTWKRIFLWCFALQPVCTNMGMNPMLVFYIHFARVKWLSSSGANLLILYSIFMLKNPINLKCLKLKLLIWNSSQ